MMVAQRAQDQAQQLLLQVVVVREVVALQQRQRTTSCPRNPTGGQGHQGWPRCASWGRTRWRCLKRHVTRRGVPH